MDIFSFFKTNKKAEIYDKTLLAVEKLTGNYNIANKLVTSPWNYLEAIIKNPEVKLTPKGLLGLIITMDSFIEIPELPFTSWLEFLTILSEDEPEKLQILKTLVTPELIHEYYKFDEYYSKSITDFVFSLSFAYDQLDSMEQEDPVDHLTRICQLVRPIAPSWTEAWLLNHQLHR